MGGIAAWLLAERGRLLLWVPVGMGGGIGAWLAWPVDPGPMVLAIMAGLALLAVLAWRAPVALMQPLGALTLALCLGFLAMAARAALVAAPVLEFRYYGPVAGRIVDIDRSATDRLRLTLDRVALDRVAPERVPGRVRISLHGPQGHVALVPGARVMMTAHLMPPEGAVEPGAFDFRRLAWLRGLGAVGYTRTPVLAQAPPTAWGAAITRLRHRLSVAIQGAIPGEAGAFAAAMLTGDRSGMGPAAVAALRDSSLYHLVSISGTHMGLLAAFVFAAVRTGLALVPPLALRLPTRKTAAVVALVAGLAYLVLAGGDVPTMRSYVMVAVMLGAVLLDRRALTLRSVALAALVILAWQPEAVVEPGFQMSFAATAALVAGFGPLNTWMAARGLAPWLRGGLTLLAASVLAGTATAPFAAAHFNRFTSYGYIANLLAGPLMGLLVMPAGVMAAVLAPLGLAAPALWLLGAGTAAILAVGTAVADLGGAVTPIASPPAWVLPLLGVVGPGLLSWRGRGRLLAVALLLAAALGWGQGERPTLLVAGDGGLLGLRVDATGQRALSQPRGNGFLARQWLENDGDLADQATAAARPGFVATATGLAFTVGGVAGRQLRGRQALAQLEAACAVAPLVVIAAEVTAPPPDCLVLDRVLLAATGPLAIRPVAGGLLVQASDGRVRRRWQPAADRQRARALTRLPAADGPAAQLLRPPGRALVTFPMTAASP